VTWKNKTTEKSVMLASLPISLRFLQSCRPKSDSPLL
jgi:hypothetical protein